ncbi:MAG: helix-turn-helix transcriptional regulator [Stackebrandtia sp.]
MRVESWQAAGEGLDVRQWHVVEDSARWRHGERLAAHRVTLVHRGVYRVRAGGWEGVVDPVTAYVNRPGHRHAIAHRPGARDGYTTITLDDALADELGADRRSATPLPIPARVDLARRALTARFRGDVDAFEVTDRVVLLVHELFADRFDPPRGSRGSPAARTARRRLADAAQEALAFAPQTSSLTALARRLGTARSHLSRVFHAETGETLTRRRARLRVQAALDSLETGDDNLSELAVRLGFADHAHLTRTMRRETGATPRELRRLLDGRRN